MNKKAEVNTFKQFIGGKWVESENGEVFEIQNPIDDS